MEKKKLKGNLLNRIAPMAIMLAITLLILSNFMIYERGIKVAEAREIMKEELRPAELQVMKIISDDCTFCFGAEKAINDLKNQNVNITNEEMISGKSQQGMDLISKYNIKKLPTIIVSGEINKSEQLANYFAEKGKIQDDKFIYTSLIPPYFDIQLSSIRGIVSITYVVDSSCNKCPDLTGISLSLKNHGVFIQGEKSVEYDSREGQDLIKQFEIKQVPAILISGEAGYYPDVKDALVQSGATNKDGFYAVHSTIPPYRDLSQNRVVGLVDSVYLTKDDCPACYNVSVNRDVLLKFGVVLNKENTYDIDSPVGKQLVQKYKIKKAPMIILSPDAKYYPLLEQSWKSVGTIENDGWFVMRNPEIVGTSIDLENGRVIQGVS